MSTKGGIFTVRMRKVLCLAVIAAMLSSSAASALSLGDLLPSKLLPSPQTSESGLLPENALVSRAEDSVYGVLRLEDTGAFLRWLVSEENIDIFMPLILKSKHSSDIMGAVEFIRAFAEKTPIKSAAVIIGTEDPDKKRPPFFQMAFTVDSSMAGTVRKIADGTAEDTDFAKLILGNDNPLTAIAQTMIKAEKLKDGSYRIDNELFLKTEGGMIVAAMSAEQLIASRNALNVEEARLFAKEARKFSDKNFAYIHLDYKTLDKLDTENALDSADKIAEIFDKPLNFELGFTSEPDKFAMSVHVNLKEAMKAEYSANISDKRVPVKGSYMNPGGSKSPLFALGGYMTLSAIKNQKDGADFWKELVRQMRVRFGINEDEFSSFFTGPFSVTVNDSVTYEGFKIPALYISQTGMKDAAGKIFARLTKSPHFQKVQEGVLQLDSSLSPVSCFIQDRGGTLSINFAELQNLGGKPVLKPALESLMNAEGIAALWIDFEAIRGWITDDENGVLAMLLPMAKMLGFGEIADAVNDVLTAEYSVPSFSFRAEDPETFRFEFGNAKIDPKNGLFARLVKIYQKFSK